MLSEIGLLNEVIDRLTYTLEDQALMSRAVQYFAWQARVIAPELGKRVVEVGCGTGNFTGSLLDRDAVIAVDIEAACVEGLRRRYPEQANLHTAVCSPEDVDFHDLKRFQPDSCVCLNVLEHIEDDGLALRSMAAILPSGGVIALLVPAFPALYGPIDRNLAHHRRYTAQSMTELARQSGLAVNKLRYFNAAGFFGWWWNARVLRREVQSKSQIEIFDQWVVPVMSKIESFVEPPFGQSLIAVLSKR
jgi:SAM-dependent methyltransferase